MAFWFQDKQLVKQLLAGDERAFDQFFDENFARLYRFALVRLSDDEDAAREVAQVGAAILETLTALANAQIVQVRRILSEALAQSAEVDPAVVEMPWLAGQLRVLQGDSQPPGKLRAVGS